MQRQNALGFISPINSAELLQSKSLDDGDIDDDDLWEDLYSWIHLDLPGIRREVKAYFDSKALRGG